MFALTMTHKKSKHVGDIIFYILNINLYGRIGHLVDIMRQFGK